MVPCESTTEEVSFEWSHHRISSTDSKVRTTLNVSITDPGSEGLIQMILSTIGNWNSNMGGKADAYLEMF